MTQLQRNGRPAEDLSFLKSSACSACFYLFLPIRLSQIWNIGTCWNERVSPRQDAISLRASLADPSVRP